MDQAKDISILVKTLFHGWKEVPVENAIRLARVIWKGAINMDDKRKEKYIGEMFVGISVKELLKDKSMSE